MLIRASIRVRAAAAQRITRTYEDLERRLRSFKKIASRLAAPPGGGDSALLRAEPPTSSAFVAEFARLLQGQGATLALPLTWIEQLLSETGQSIDQLVQAENQRQATDQVSISNSIGSLRFLTATDWRVFNEAVSQVEQVVVTDHAGVYAQMDFVTRDRCRHAVERIAASSPRVSPGAACCPRYR